MDIVSVRPLKDEWQQTCCSYVARTRKWPSFLTVNASIPKLACCDFGFRRTAVVPAHIRDREYTMLLYPQMGQIHLHGWASPIILQLIVRTERWPLHRGRHLSGRQNQHFQHEYFFVPWPSVFISPTRDRVPKVSLTLGFSREKAR